MCSLEDVGSIVDVEEVAQVSESDIELTIAHTVTGHAKHMDGASVLSDLCTDEGITEGYDVGDLLDVGDGGASEGLRVMVSTLRA